MREARIDWSTIAGLVTAVAGIVGGLLLEGGNLADITQATAALIVLGGTAGAVMVTTPYTVLADALRRARWLILAPRDEAAPLIEDVIGYAAQARKSGLVSLESTADEIPDPFLRKAMQLAVDGVDLQQLKAIMLLEIEREEQQGEAAARVYEAAGGYAPTVGIIGAVLGLIQVMKHLQNLDEVGKGIAVAFVATVYGVGVANLLLLPAAAKLRARLRSRIALRELALTAVLGIAEGLNPKLLKRKLDAYHEAPGNAKRQTAAAPLPAPQPEEVEA